MRRWISQRESAAKPTTYISVKELQGAQTLVTAINTDILRAAGFSRCARYRYWLSRTWDTSGERCLFIGLNPSTADAEADDPTIRRIMGFARDWGYGGVIVANLFAWRATDPEDLKRATDPIGPRNNYWLRRLPSKSDEVIAAWGNDGRFQQRQRYVLARIPRLKCLGITARGCPRHPLYVRARTVSVPLDC